MFVIRWKEVNENKNRSEYKSDTVLSDVGVSLIVEKLIEKAHDGTVIYDVDIEQVED